MPEQKVTIVTDDPYINGVQVGRKAMASAIRSEVLERLLPDDSPDRQAALLEAAQIATRMGRLAPLPAGEGAEHVET